MYTHIPNPQKVSRVVGRVGVRTVPSSLPESSRGAGWSGRDARQVTDLHSHLMTSFCSGDRFGGRGCAITGFKRESPPTMAQADAQGAATDCLPIPNLPHLQPTPQPQPQPREQR